MDFSLSFKATLLVQLIIAQIEKEMQLNPFMVSLKIRQKVWNQLFTLLPDRVVAYFKNFTSFSSSPNILILLFYCKPSELESIKTQWDFRLGIWNKVQFWPSHKIHCKCTFICPKKEGGKCFKTQSYKRMSMIKLKLSISEIRNSFQNDSAVFQALNNKILLCCVWQLFW